MLCEVHRTCLLEFCINDTSLGKSFKVVLFTLLSYLKQIDSNMVFH